MGVCSYNISPMSRPKILVVHRRSTYTDLVSDRRHARMTKLVRDADPLVAGIVKAHENHIASMQQVKSTLKKRGLTATYRHFIENLAPSDFDLIVTVGGDGTVLHASHSINNTPILAINSSPVTSVGFFTAANASNFGEILDQVLAGTIKPVTLSRMKVQVNDKVITRHALNDVLFCHDCPASTTRYALSFNDNVEDQISSGVWISTAAGSTAAIQAGGGKAMPPRSKRLQFAVREAYSSRGKANRSSPKMIRGFIPDGDVLKIRSRTEAAGLYVDGPHLVFPVNLGDVVTFSRSDVSLRLFGYYEKE
jgi:NAD+ kinase